MQDGKPKREETAGSKKRKALGKGLGALIPGPAKVLPSSLPEPEEKNYFQCRVSLIHPNRYQPRRTFSEEELGELSQSIAEQGIIQPLVVRKNTEGYELVAGERRLRAAKMAGLKEVPVVCLEISEAALLEMSLVENIQRENLNSLEEAEAYHRLMTEFGLTQEQVAIRVGKSRSAVANFLRLRQLPDEIKETLLDGTLSMGHAKVLLAAENAAQQMTAWRLIIARGLSVRDAEHLLERLKARKPEAEPPSPAPETAYFFDVAEQLSRRFGTKVEIRRRGKRGKVEIEFYNDDDLDRLLSLLSTEE